MSDAYLVSLPQGEVASALFLAVVLVAVGNSGVFVQNRGCGLEVSELRGDLDADERVEMGNTCLGGE